MLHPWEHSRPGWTGRRVTRSGRSCPCSLQRGWTGWPPKVPSNPNHSVIPGGTPVTLADVPEVRAELTRSSYLGRGWVQHQRRARTPGSCQTKRPCDGPTEVLAAWCSACRRLSWRCRAVRCPARRTGGRRVCTQLGSC